jgi:hypothetical protein
MKWNDVIRSETPINWRRLLDDLMITPERFVATLDEFERRIKVDIRFNQDDVFFELHDGINPAPGDDEPEDDDDDLDDDEDEGDEEENDDEEDDEDDDDGA